MNIGSLLLSAMLLCGSSVGTACHGCGMNECARMTQDPTCYRYEAEDYCAIYGPTEWERVAPACPAQAPACQPDCPRPSDSCGTHHAGYGSHHGAGHGHHH